MGFDGRFDPGDAAQPGSGLFGLSHTVEEAGVIVIPIGFDATTSYRRGAAQGPQAVLQASHQVDLFDLETGRPYEAGIALLPEDESIPTWNKKGREAADLVIERGGVDPNDAKLVRAAERVNELGASINSYLVAAASEWLAMGKLVVTLGGDHSIPYGAIEAHAKLYPGLGILHLDAHADLRAAYEGFTWSHASIMHNVSKNIPDVGRIVQVGIRDLSEEEHRAINESNGRIVTFFDATLKGERFAGTTFAEQLIRIVAVLPKHVYLSFDIDGLDPALCPHTGTPVPGGLAFAEAAALVAAVARSGRRIVGMDLCEVAPGPEGDDWDGNVGARLLYKMIGWAIASQKN